MARFRKPKQVAATLIAILAVATVFALSFAHPSRLAIRHSAPRTAVPVNGRLVKLLVHSGDVVQKGQLLGYLDSTSYEADLKKAESDLQTVESQTQNTIQPMEAIPGLTGTLPKRPSRPEYLTVADAPVKVKPKKEQAKAVAKPAAPAVDPFKRALGDQQKAKAALDDDALALKKATTGLADAQKARDALRPKIAQADVDSKQAAKKAANTKELLDAGVISVKRSEAMLADKDTTQKALDDLRAQAATADQAVNDAQSRLQGAKDSLDRATEALKSSDDLLAKAAEAPQPAPIKPSPLTAPKAPIDKPAQTETKVVMRRMPMAVHLEPPPAIPLKVFVDEKTMVSSAKQIHDLQARIAELKARIEECKVCAPASGWIEVLPSGAVEIRVAQAFTSSSDR